jgi:hypothetical protein
VSGPAAQNSQRVTVISARVEAVVTQREYTPSTNTVAYDAIDDAEFQDVSASSLPATTGRPSTTVATRAYSSYAASSRGTAFGGASAYARTQDLSERHPIIDTYA